MSAARPRRAEGTEQRPWGLWGLRGAALTYLGLMIAVPLAAVIQRGFADGLGAFWRELSSPIAFDALKLTLFAAAITTAVNLVLGTLTAYVLARYRFPGRGVLDSFVDMPFAIPTLVTGVMLVVLYGPTGVLGEWFESRGISVIFAKPGIVLALLFVTYPFVIRTVQPVLLEAERREEEAAFTLGASKWTNFRRIVLPTILPAAFSGALLCFARAVGEFGSIVVVAGNIPRRTLTAPVYVFGEIEAHNERGASAMSVVLLALSFGLLLFLDWRQRRRAEVLGG
ncbi:MAG TPA: sulfate ABC transporter permease subunit CysT [Thermoanaerobaculia bacterium]|jgi:sulfate transport system permease protein|nr:sulfate ABC transporter permease subunit CysT [Thermoanaerobaculia bacterium]